MVFQGAQQQFPPFSESSAKNFVRGIPPNFELVRGTFFARVWSMIWKHVWKVLWSMLGFFWTVFVRFLEVRQLIMNIHKNL